jgi:ABC-type Fe3+ transport system permease subunit
MAEKSRVYHSREAGLSEVIGFVLIIGLLVVVASLYLTYGIPAQGRENEILHMNEVKDQFVAYKLSLDSLFNNNKVGTTVSNSFTLGTSGGFTQGTVGFLPIMSPVNSGGTSKNRGAGNTHDLLPVPYP